MWRSRSNLPAPTSLMLLLVAIALVASACGPGESQDTGPVELTIAEPAQFVGAAPLYIAIDEGYFAERDITIDIATLTATGGAHTDAVLAGEAWAFIGGIEHVLFANAQGADLRALTSLEDRPAYYLVGHADGDPPADLTEALRGSSIAVLPTGATPNTVLRWHLHASGLDPATDVDLLEGSVDHLFGSMATGTADYAVVFEPILDIGQLEGTWGPPLTDWPADVGPMGNTILGISATTADEQEQVVDRFLAALEEARELMRNDPERAEELLQARFDLPPDMMATILERADKGDFFSETGEISEEAVERAAELIRTAGLYDAEFTFEDVVATQYQR